jgi:predicted sugar kinase
MDTIEVGTVRNPLDACLLQVPGTVYQMVDVSYPARLNAMAVDPARIEINDTGRYAAGEVIFSVGLHLNVQVRRIGSAGSDIVQARRSPLVRHAVLIMRAALGFVDRLEISVDNENELRHVGLGSSSRLIAAVGAAINELCGRPFSNALLLRYLAWNHAEEIDGSETQVMPVQCLGGSGASGLFAGSVQVVAGHSTVVAAGNVTGDYHVIIGMPVDYEEKDAAELMAAEIAMLPKFVHTGVTYGPQIAYRVLHEMLPAIAEGRLGPVGDVIYWYRFDLGSIDNCSFVYDGLMEIAERLREIHERGLADVVALSSVGPGFFVITTQPEICGDIMRGAGLRLIHTRLHDGTYTMTRSA